MNYPSQEVLDSVARYIQGVNVYMMAKKEFRLPNGTYFWSNAAHGEGRDGKWRVTFPDGASYVGGLTDWGAFHLYGELTEPSGRVVCGYWREGQFYGDQKWWLQYM